MFSKKLFQELLKSTEWERLSCDIIYCYWDIDEYLQCFIKKDDKEYSTEMLFDLYD